MPVYPGYVGTSEPVYGYGQTGIGNFPNAISPNAQPNGQFLVPWTPYGPEAGEAFNGLDAVTTTPTLGTGAGFARVMRYCVTPPGIVHGYVMFGWGTGGTAGSGKYGILLPPVGGPSLFPGAPGPVPAGETLGWAELGQDQFAVQHMEECSITYNAGNAIGNIPANRCAIINPHRYAFRGSNAGAFNAFGQVTVTHGLGQAPDKVDVDPTGFGVQGNDNGLLAVTTKGATTFVVTAITFGRKSLADGVTTAASTAISSATALFTSADVQQLITGTNIPANTFITGVTDTQHATLSQNASASGTGIQFTIGHGAGAVSIPFDWQAWAAINGTNNGGLFVTDSWPWAWGAQYNNIECRFAYPITGIS